MLFDALRDPARKPPLDAELEERLDVVDKRLDRLERLVAGYKRADAALRRR
jgi:hypothetical protein